MIIQSTLVVDTYEIDYYIGSEVTIRVLCKQESLDLKNFIATKDVVKGREHYYENTKQLMEDYQDVTRDWDRQKS